METVLTIALSGLGTAEGLLKRRAAKEQDAKKKKKLQKVASGIREAREAIEDLLADEAFAE